MKPKIYSSVPCPQLTVVHPRWFSISIRLIINCHSFLAITACFSGNFWNLFLWYKIFEIMQLFRAYYVSFNEYDAFLCLTNDCLGIKCMFLLTFISIFAMRILEISKVSKMNIETVISSRRGVKWAPESVHPIKSWKKVTLVCTSTKSIVIYVSISYNEPHIISNIFNTLPHQQRDRSPSEFRKLLVSLTQISRESKGHVIILHFIIKPNPIFQFPCSFRLSFWIWILKESSTNFADTSAWTISSLPRPSP